MATGSSSRSAAARPTRRVRRRDVRFVKDGVARALRTLRAAAGPVPEDQVVPLSPQMVRLRFAAAARAAGVEARVTAHSRRVGLALEVTSRGASTTDVMLAGNWKTTPGRPRCYTSWMRPNPTSPLLPLFDDSDSPPQSPGARRSPTAFICYAHETRTHNQHVEDLAHKLRAQGVDCNADIFEVSPPEGWFRWMLTQVKDSDFVIVVCTETHARRITASPTSKTGRGVRWEEGAILQCLFEEGENRRFIPVAFDQAGLDHIPQALKSATYYDLSTDAGYPALHRALTNQPWVEKPPLGELTTRVPLLGPLESTVSALLVACPDPLPLELVARVAGQDATRVSTTLQRLRNTGVLAIADNAILLKTRNVDGIRSLSDDEVGVALGAVLDFLKKHPKAAAGRAQLRNVVTLSRAASMNTAAAVVSHTFRTIQSFLKSSGNKRLVLEIARRSIEASKQPGRGREQTKDEAVATICGVSWVYQRTGRLSEALAKAERSLQLGEDIAWRKNTAFCHKCLGRLKRMEAEAVQKEPGRRAALLQDSVSYLREAIQDFTDLKLAAEVGDCYSLLARTYLAARDRERARAAIEEATQRVVDPTNKDYIDLQIVKGDLMLGVNRRRAKDLYSEVIAAAKDGGDDAQQSEITARAYLQRGRVRRVLSDDGARTDFEAAAEIWELLEDPMASVAHWESRRVATWIDREAKAMLDREPVGVRVRAAQIVDDETARRPPARAHRQKVTRQYLQDAINRAREQLAVDRPAW